jgi:hypothetical protein
LLEDIAIQYALIGPSEGAGSVHKNARNLFALCRMEQMDVAAVVARVSGSSDA